MKGLAWNCRGLKDPLAPSIPKIRAICRSFHNNLDFVFLSETKCDVRSVDVLLRPMGFLQSAGCDADGLKKGEGGGGLWVGWKSSCKLECVFSSRNLIIFLVNQCKGSLWYLCCVYGEPDHTMRGAVWESFTCHFNSFDKTFLLFGDFDQVEFSSDKLGGSDKLIRGASLFSYWKNLHCLMDIPFKGPRFTWCNNRDNPHRIYERLDEGFASNDWLSLFPNTFIKHLPIQISDHAPIILDTNMILHTKKKIYRLDAWCFDHAECSSLVKESWGRKDKGDASHALLSNLRRINNVFRVWACNKKDEWDLKWSAFDQDLESYLLDIENGGDTINYESCHKKLVEFSIAAGTYWRQRTKLNWNCEGDTCTKYFFNWVKGRSGANLILGINKGV
ncbi:uncharacterized protein LOC141619909 [Silene latifolia]|uniref:uncharacterized protein LOC141619909 n=1 Tax=Silene latifolia TaxID=37657 RepID=UPI003D783380